MIYCEYGRMLRVNLSTNDIQMEEMRNYDVKRFIGGEGIAAKIYFDEVRSETKPFDPENRLIFATGPLTGALGPGTSRSIVAGKSPHSYPESYTISSFGGEWGPELRYAGYDVIVIHGISLDPAYLWIKNEKVEIRDAKHLWGLNTFETQERIKEEIADEEAQIITIGPAGENMVRYACIIHRSGSAAGQGGFGAIMGSKNLKAIAVRGNKGVKVAKPEELMKLTEYINKILTVLGITTEDSAFYRAYTRVNAAVGEDLIPFIEKYKVRNTGCLDCARHCKVFLNVPEMGGGEMSCVQFFYAWLQLGAIESVNETSFLAKQLADQYGINVYELLQLIPYLLVLHDKNMVSDEEADIPISKFPAREFIEALLDKVANREGFGDALAEGTWRFAKRYGRLEEYLNMDEELALNFGPFAGFMGYGAGCHGYCAHYCPRDFIMSGLLWSMGHRDPWSSNHEYVSLVEWSGLEHEQQKEIAEIAWGSKDAIHPRGRPKYDEHEAKAAIITQNRSLVKNMLTLCDWLYPIICTPYREDHKGDLTVQSKLFTAILGIEVTEEELLKAGERVFNLERAILVREGRRREDDTLPEHLFKNFHYWTGSPPIDKDKWEELKDIYYKLRGWDHKTGIPTRKKLELLDLKDIATSLEELGLLPK